MNFCFLTNYFPMSVKVNGRDVTLDTRTSTAISCLLYLQSDKSDYEKAEYCALRLFGKPYGKVLKMLGCDHSQLDKAIMKYLNGADELKPQVEQANAKKTFDFVQDSGAIVCSFRKDYGLSVLEVQNLHYWEFLVLLENMTGENAFNNVRTIRSMKIDKKTDSLERQQEIKKAKRAVALVDTRTKEEKRADLQRQFNKLLDD